MSANRKVVFSPSLESGQRDWPDVDSFCEQLWLPYQQHGNASRERKSNYRIPSDQLRHLRELVSAWPLLAQTFGEILQLRVVIDANVAFEQLIWRLRRRRDPGARTGLHEAIDSGVVIAFAPQALQQEVLQHISEFAEDAKVPLTLEVREWEQLQLQIHFYEPEPAKKLDPNCADPDDLPYKLVCEQLGAHAVYSRDPHLQKMNAPVISVQLDLTVRDYARATAVRLTLHLGTTYTVMLGIASVIGFAKACRACMRALTRLPTAAKIVIAAGVLLAVAHPKSRAKLSKLLDAVRGQFNDLKPLLGEGFLELVTQLSAADRSASETANTIRSAIPPGRRLPAIVRARAICLTSKEALNIQQIETRMRNDGYVSKSRNLGSYLRRIMRSDGDSQRSLRVGGQSKLRGSLQVLEVSSTFGCPGIPS